MARPTKQGIEYFSFDTDFFSDRKVRRLMNACGPNSISILICLLCNIYKDKGYYILWDEELPFDIADSIGVSEGSVLELVKKSVQVGFFDKVMFEKYNILTSSGIQKRFLASTYKRKEIDFNEDYAVIDIKNSVNDGLLTSETKLLTSESTQKESKVKKSKVKEESTNVDAMSNGNSHSTNSDKIDYNLLVDFFNRETKGVFGNIRYPMSDKRKDSIRARIREHGKETFVDMVRKAARSEFLKGENNRGFKATFDWLIKPNNFQKVIEGNYENRSKTNSGVSSGINEDFLRNIAEGISRGHTED